MELLPTEPVAVVFAPVPRLMLVAPVPLAARRKTVPVAPTKTSCPESRSTVPRFSVSTLRRLAPAPRRRECWPPPAAPPMVRVPAVTAFWTLPSVTWVSAVPILSLLRDTMTEPVAPAFRLTNVSVDRSVVEVVAMFVVLGPWPKTIVRALPSPRFSVPAPAKVRLVVLAVFFVLPTVVLPVMVSERPKPMVIVLAVAEATWTFRLPKVALALVRSRLTAFVLALVLPKTSAPVPKFARTGAVGANGELPRPACWKLTVPLSRVRFGLFAVVTRPESVRAAVPDFTRVPRPAIVPRKVLATLAVPTVTVAATGVPAVSWSESVPALVGPRSWARVKAVVPALAMSEPPLRVTTLAAAPMPAEPRRTSPALTTRPPVYVFAPERTRAPGPDLTTALAPEMTPERVSTPVPYCWTKSCVPVAVRLELIVSFEVTVLSTRRPPEVRVRVLAETVLAVVPVRRTALAETLAVSAVVAAETE